MRTTFAIAAIALASTSSGVLAGEDSTERYGAGGTGQAYYEAACGLKGFTGPSADAPRPCVIAGMHYQTGDDGILNVQGVAGSTQSTTAGAPANDGHADPKKTETQK